MSYNITLTNGQLLVSIADGTADTSYSSLTLFGKNYAGYGPLLDENFVNLLENFSNSTAPTSPLQGQIWWDSTNRLMKVFKNSGWKVISGPTASAVTPVSDTIGDLWWDTTKRQLNSFNGTSWDLVGPLYTIAQGLSGPKTITVTDNFSLPHVVVVNYVSGIAVSVESKDPAFTTTDIVGFNLIKPGYNILASSQFQGDASNALSLGGTLAGNFLRSDVVSTTNNALNVAANAGLTVGLNTDLTLNVESGSTNIISEILNRNLDFQVNYTGIPSLALRINGSTGLVTVLGPPTSSLGVATKGYVDTELATAGSLWIKADGSTLIEGSLVPSINSVYSLGSAATKFSAMYANTYYGTNTIVQAADLAENYSANQQIEPGTVVEFGGDFDVRVCNEDRSSKVAGVVSTNPGYLMNADCNSQHVVAVALQGRVPCKVTGNIEKGDCLVSAGNGRARAEKTPAAGTIIGKALKYFHGKEGIIEVAIGRF